MLVSSAAWSQILGDRPSQQDSAAVVAWPNGYKLLILADGMGGHVGGDLASQLAVEAFKANMLAAEGEDVRNNLLDAMEAANVAIYQRLKETPDLMGMGTTLVGVLFDGDAIVWVSVGDSPLWLFRDAQVQRLNQDHSMASVFAGRVARGEMSESEARTDPARSQLLEAVLGENIEMFDAPNSPMTLHPGDVLILASDGVQTCSDDQLAQVLKSHDDQTAEKLVSVVLGAVEDVNRPKQDNATLVVLKVYAEKSAQG